MWLSEILKRREVGSVVWFHVDHWEPWGQDVTDASCARLDTFTHAIARTRFGRKLTLFYLDGLDCRLKPAAQYSPFSVPGDIVEFRPRSEAQDRRVREGIRNLQAETEVEFQVHLHHEHLTLNNRHWGERHRRLKEHSDSALDEQRLRLLLRITLDTIRRDTGLTLDRWAFIHGMWALNASDPDICKVENEIELLAEHGCWGDFTFPAGLPHVDPKILDRPYTIRPITSARCYDLPSCEPLAIGTGSRAFAPDRFLIWHSGAPHDVTSLDCNNESHRTRLRQRSHIVSSWLRLSPIIGGVLYIKTYAHCMDPVYYDDLRLLPFCNPSVLGTLEMLEEACVTAGVELRLQTVDEVAAELRAADEAGADLRPAEPRRMGKPVHGTTPAQPGISSVARRCVDPYEVNRLATAFFANWLARDHARLSGAGEYYIDKVQRQDLIPSYDVVAADYAVRNLPADTCCVELGSGFGELGFLLALGGLYSIGIEDDELRYEGAVALQRRLQQEGAPLSNLVFVQAAFPCALDPDILPAGRETALFCTNTTGTGILDRLDGVLRALQSFDHLVINLLRFGTVCEPNGEGAVHEQLQALGFNEVTRVFRDNDADIRHFTRGNQPAASLRWAIRESAPALPPPARSRLDFLDGYIFRFLQELLEREGAEKSGLFSYYAIRVTDGGGGLADYELAVARYIVRNFPTDSRRVLHAGIGIGTTTAVLADAGFRVIGIEADFRRMAVARSLRRQLGAVWPALQLRYELVEDYFPDVLGRNVTMGKDVVLLFTNVASDWRDELLESILNTFPRAGDVILNLRLFGDIRTPEQQADLYRRIIALGPQEVLEGPSVDEDRFWHFRF